MESKLSQFLENREYLALNPWNKNFLNRLCSLWRFTSQEIRQIIRIARDLETWDEGSLEDFCLRLWPAMEPEKPGNRSEKDKKFKVLTEGWTQLKENPKDYHGFRPEKAQSPPLDFENLEDDRQILGDCPVASPKTRCCNLKTLDAVTGCGFDCSYCSIQSFYSGGKIQLHKNLKEKLSRLKLDPKKVMHIGTGQSSDSLMWGNKDGLLESLCDFARQYPRLILELKSKSSRIDELLSLGPPPNILLTWSLNTPAVIQAEERLTSSLERRMEAARKAADSGMPVGFHLHPIVWYKGWEEDYGALCRRMTELFSPEEVVNVSMGTLTFIKPVLKQLRERPIRSKILQMPLEAAAGKFSYPLRIKEEIFSKIYGFLKPWHGKVFFYLCMEDPELWEPVFGKSYVENADFEEDMLYNYEKKILDIQNRSLRV